MPESEIVFEHDGLRVIKYARGVISKRDDENRTRYELIRDFDAEVDPVDTFGNISITISEEQMMALVTSFPVPEPVLATEDLVLSDREILPISDRKFGVVITEKEAVSLPRGGYRVMTFPVPSRQRRGEPVKHYIDVYLKKDDRLAGRFDLTALEIRARGNITITPVKWPWANGVGVKAFAKSAEVVP